MDIDLVRAKLTVDPTTQADVWTALSANAPFPDCAISLGSIRAQYATGEIPIALGGGANVSLTASFSAGGHSGIGIFPTAAAAVASLGLDPCVTPDFPAGPDDRFLVLSFDASAQGSVSGTAPLGVIGSATFGASGSGTTRFAVLYRFSKTTGSVTVLEQAGACIKLPREVKNAADLAQGAWILAEVDGSLALSAAASVGYDYTYTRDLPTQLQQLGLSKDLNVKVDAAATATVGYNVSGRYLVMVGRPSLVADQVIALQVNKGSSYGYSFGLNLSAGVQMTEVLPKKGEDLVAASFGIFGPQIVTDVSKSIAALEAWSTGDLAANTAALTIHSAKSLLTAVTGINADAALAEATAVLKAGLAKWNALVQQGSSDLQTLAWGLLGNPANKTLILKLLTDLQTHTSFDAALSDGLQSLPGQTWLLAIANAIGATSVLSLGAHQADVKSIAGYALDVLSDGNENVIPRLQQYITKRFDLTGIIATATDPARLDQWVRDRLAAFLNKTGLTSGDLKAIQTATKALLTKFDDVYAKTTAALTRKYNFTFAASYEQVADNSTLLNLSFDVSKPNVLSVYQQVLGGATSAIFQLQAPLSGLTLHGAVMTHGIHTTAKASLTLPYLSTATTDLNTSIAKLSFDRNGSDLVGYLDATDQVEADRYRSLFRLALQLGLKGGSITSINGSLAYEMRAIAPAATRSMITMATAAFVQGYFGSKFPPNEYSDRFLADFDSAVQHMPSNQFGDMVMSMQLAIDGDFLSAWVVPQTQLLAAQILASRTVQRCLRSYTHQLYFRNTKQIDSWDTLPLLVWESLPVCTGIEWDPGNATLGSTNTGKNPYMSNEDGAGDDPLLKALIARSFGTLQVIEASAYQEVLAAGIKKPALITASTAQAAKQMEDYSSSGVGLLKLKSLMLAESGVVKGVAKALQSISEAGTAISLSEPSQLLKHLSEFGAELTGALNRNMSSLFAPTELRLFGPMLLVELTRALSHAGAGVGTKAMLELKSLKPQHTFDIATYLGGSEPGPDQILVSQTMVSV